MAQLEHESKKEHKKVIFQVQDRPVSWVFYAKAWGQQGQSLARNQETTDVSAGSRVHLVGNPDMP